MTHSVAKAGPYYSSGQISFSSLRTNFRALQPRDSYGGSESTLTDNNPIKVSDLLRNVDENNTSPIVPNSTENSNIQSSASNWKTSQFRNSIKYYYVQHSGTDTNVDIDSQNWNSNLSLNVRKIYFVDGTQGSNSPGSPASTINAKSINLTIDVRGSIFGASGKGGGTTGAPSISGGTGGDALNADLGTSSKNVVINLRTGGKIYAGGGGGEKGQTGSNGSSKECEDRYTADNCGGCPGCASGYSNDGGCWSGSACNRRTVCNWWGNCWQEDSEWIRYQNCRKTFTLSGGTGGEGGNGGPGRGYDNQGGSLDGVGGSSGTSGLNCNTSGGGSSGSGATGENGANGGEWGNSGGNTTNTGSGGASGRAIFGSNYTVVGANSSTVKGSYNP